jgi:two-component system LytT family response regulator
MRALIVDDEAPARAKLRRLLGADPELTIVGEAADGREAVTRITELRPDVVFLDVQMPLLDGFGVIDHIGVDMMPYVVFVTAYDEHALRAFEVQALDYVLKPFSPERLQAVVGRVRRELARGTALDVGPRLTALLQQVASPSPRYLHRILVQREGRAVLVPVQQIDRLEAERNDVRLHTRGGVHVVRGTLGELADRLDPAMFMRINRSTIVRLDAIKELQSWFHGDYRVVLQDGTELMWSRRYRAKNRAAFELGREAER